MSTEDPNVEDYQRATRKVAVYPDADNRSITALEYVIMALGGEVGSLQNKFKKILRGDYYGGFGEYKVNTLTDLTRGIPHDHEIREALQDMDAEVGDILWYLLRYCEERGLWMDDLLLDNHQKLTSRAQRGVIKGKGSNR